jgi:hypothetical protein
MKGTIPMFWLPLLQFLLRQLSTRTHLVGIGIVFILSSTAFGEESGLRNIFFEHYLPHAKQLEESYSNIHVKYHFYQVGANGKSNGWLLDGKYNRLNYSLEGVSAIFDNQTKQPVSRDAKKTISCRNAFYTFDLRPGENDQYILDKLDIYKPVNPPELGTLNVPYADVDRKKTYLEIAQDEATRIVGFNDIRWQNKLRKVLKTQFIQIDRRSKKSFTMTEEYYFSPEDNWVCCGKRGYENTPGPEYIEERYYYEAKGGDQLPALKRLESWLVNLRNPEKSRIFMNLEITEFRRSPTPFPDSDFRLSAFGLPEPMGVEPLPPKPRTWLWLTIIALAAAVMAFLFAWLKRRRATVIRASASAPSPRSAS